MRKAVVTIVSLIASCLFVSYWWIIASFSELSASRFVVGVLIFLLPGFFLLFYGYTGKRYILAISVVRGLLCLLFLWYIGQHPNLIQHLK